MQDKIENTWHRHSWFPAFVGYLWLLFGKEHPIYIGSVSNLWREPIALCHSDWGAVAKEIYNGYEIVDFFLPSVRQSCT